MRKMRISRAGGVAALLLLAGPVAVAHGVTVTPANLSFGVVPVGTSSTVTYSVQNTGGGSVTGGVSGFSAPFSVVSGTPYSLAPGQTCGVTVRFAPLLAQGYLGQATFSGGTGMVAQELSDDAEVGAIPIVFLTGMLNEDDVARFKACGETALLKPVNLGKLRQCIEDRLGAVGLHPMAVDRPVG